jgi:hypothetical protein
MKKIRIIRSRPLKEEEEVIDQQSQDTAPETSKFTYESNPLEFMLMKYPTLTKTLTDLLTDDFRNYITGVYIMAPKPTIFKIVLHNNRSFYLIYMGDDKYEAKISGKKYWLPSLGEFERATVSIAELLMMGAPPTTQGPETEMSSTPEEIPTETPAEEEIETPEELQETKKKLGITLIKESPESDILSFLKSDKTVASLSPDKIVKDKSGGYKVYFSGINTRDKKGRKDVLSNLKSKGNVKVSYNPERVSWSSIGTATITKGNKTYTITIKGTSETSTSTNVKEGLVILFFDTKIGKPVTEDNFDKVVAVLNKALNKATGIDSKTQAELGEYLSSLSNTPVNINNLNQPLSQALTIKDVYEGFTLTRTGIFNEYRALANAKLGLPADKWCPGDVYIVLNEDKAKKILINAAKQDNGASVAEVLNEAFNEKWGGKKSPLTAISLKFEKAQGGKAKAYFDKFKAAKTKYNLDDNELKFKSEQYKQGIERLRKEINGKTTNAENIKYTLVPGKLKNDLDFLRAKYAALKAINFFFTQIKSPQEYDDALLSLAAFAMSLSDTSPAFFKVVANSKGEVGEVETFERGTSLSLLVDEAGNIDPIEITDSDTYGGLEIKMKINKGGEHELVKINARNNGAVQGTIEIGKIIKIKEITRFKLK